MRDLIGATRYRLACWLYGAANRAENAANNWLMREHQLHLQRSWERTRNATRRR